MTSNAITRARQPQGTPIGGQFAAEQRPGADIALSMPNPDRFDVRDEVDHILSQLNDSAQIDALRWRGAEKDPTYPHAEHEAAIAALNAYRDALGANLSPAGERTGNYGAVHVPMFIDATLRPHHNEPLPQWPVGVDEPRVSFELEDGMVKTAVSFDDRFLVVWTMNDETYTSAETDDSVLEGIDDEDADAIQEWAQEVHSRIDGIAYGVQLEAVNRQDINDTVINLALSEPEG